MYTLADTFTNIEDSNTGNMLGYLTSAMNEQDWIVHVGHNWYRCTVSKTHSQDTAYGISIVIARDNKRTG